MNYFYKDMMRHYCYVSACFLSILVVYYIMTKQFLIHELTRYYVQYSKSPTFRDMADADTYPAPITFVKTFGTWNNALRAANLIVRQHRYHLKELQNWLLNFKIKHNRLPKHREIPGGIRQGMVSAFGNLRNCFMKINSSSIDINKSKIPTINNIRKEIKLFIYKHKRNPTLIDVKNKAFTFNNFHINMVGGISQFYSKKFPSNNIYTTYCRYKAKDNHLCYSQTELHLDNWFFDHKIKHAKEVRYPKDKLNPKNNLRCDFIVNGIWVEFAGIYGNSNYLKRLKRKRRLASKYKIPLIILTVNDVLSNGKLNEKRLFALFVSK
jgi:hypothetical protein